MPTESIEHQLLLLLTDNMKEMETELRAHSIVFEALTEEVIDPAQIGEALCWARESESMLSLVSAKYAAFEKLRSRLETVADHGLGQGFRSLTYTH